jgi:hypothetical protein
MAVVTACGDSYGSDLGVAAPIRWPGLLVAQIQANGQTGTGSGPELRCGS